MVVDCPTCGRSVKVPQKDGQAERVGVPALDHEDSQLAKALNEVAAIAQSSSVALPELPPRYQRSGDVRETREVHAPPPKVIPADPQPPAEPIEPPSEPPVDEDEETLCAHSALAELATLAQSESPDAPSRPTIPPPFGQFAWTNELPWRLWLAFLMVGFVAIAVGFAVGRWDGKNHSENSSPETNPGQSAGSPTPGPQPVDPMLRLGRPAVRGAVKTSTGQAGSAIASDENAWIYAFPQNPAGEEQIPAEWFAAADRKTLTQALRLLGGNAVPAGKEGRFELRLIRPGRYHILVCSSRKSGTGQEPMPEFLNDYVQNPEKSLNNGLFHAEDIDFQGNAVDLDLEPLQP